MVPGLGGIVEKRSGGGLNDQFLERHIGLGLAFDQAVEVFKIRGVVLGVVVHNLLFGQERFHGAHGIGQGGLLEWHFCSSFLCVCIRFGGEKPIAQCNTGPGSQRTGQKFTSFHGNVLQKTKWERAPGLYDFFAKNGKNSKPVPVLSELSLSLKYTRQGKKKQARGFWGFALL